MGMASAHLANPLLATGAELFAMVGYLRETATHNNVPYLQQQLVERIRDFHTTLEGLVTPDEAGIARYCLCVLLDETVLSTPWGSEGVWSERSLLIHFHQEAWGGEKFFQILANLLRAPAQNLRLLEFLHVCLSLGLEGKFRVLDRGAERLQQVTNELYATIRNQRGDFEADLSPHWPGVMLAHRLSQMVPLSILIGGACLLMLAIYFFFAYALRAAVAPELADLKAVGRAVTLPMLPEKVIPPAIPIPVPVPVPVAPPPAPPVAVAPEPKLRAFLAPEVKAGLVEVVEEDGTTLITVKGDGLFPPGSDVVRKEQLPLLRRIGVALNRETGEILVTGHTDSVPIHNERFPSNQKLSEERAKAVMKILAQEVEAHPRLHAEGRGEGEPIAPNMTAEGRARNRRVEIALLSLLPKP
jgi:type VI secretion system protein ImpK